MGPCPNRLRSGRDAPRKCIRFDRLESFVLAVTRCATSSTPASSLRNYFRVATRIRLLTIALTDARVPSFARDSAGIA